MTTNLLDRGANGTSIAPAQRLRQSSGAVRVSLHWLGVRKTLTPTQKNQAAEPFSAEGQFLSASKKLLDTKHPAYREVTAVRGRVLACWKGCTLAYPDPGVRLIKQGQVEHFHGQMEEFRGQLDEAVAKLDRHYADLKAAARRRLGQLFNEADYPPELTGLFSLEWEFPTIEPPDYLYELSPALYEQERQRVASRFEEAVRLAEEAFAGELAHLIDHLAERLAPGPEGQRKVFRDSALGNFSEFFQRFQRLNVSSNAQLDALVEQAQQLLQGVTPDQVRTWPELRQRVQAGMEGVRQQLDNLVIDAPRRRIIRPSAAPNGETHATGD